MKYIKKYESFWGLFGGVFLGTFIAKEMYKYLRNNKDKKFVFYILKNMRTEDGESLSKLTEDGDIIKISNDKISLELNKKEKTLSYIFGRVYTHEIKVNLTNKDYKYINECFSFASGVFKEVSYSYQELVDMDYSVFVYDYDFINKKIRISIKNNREDIDLNLVYDCIDKFTIMYDVVLVKSNENNSVYKENDEYKLNRDTDSKLTEVKATFKYNKRD